MSHSNYLFHCQLIISSSLESLHPKRDSHMNEALVVVAVGSTNNLVFKGGPQPWYGKPSSHFKQSKSLPVPAVGIIRCLEISPSINIRN